MNENKKVVCVFAAHPDDEVLGCGATIAKHVENGDEVHVCIMAEGLTSRDAKRDLEKHKGNLVELKNIAVKANEIIGSTSIHFLDFPDNRMDSVDLIDVVKAVESQVYKYQPNIVYTHHASDVNIDHQRIHQAVVTACRPQPGYAVKRLLAFEVMSSTEWQPASSKIAFNPNWYVDTGAFIEKKIKALEAYQCEMRDWPHARSINAVKALAMYRGASVGVNAAEAFVLMRNIEV
jgi:N-acetylglucosamine malate deacetylase 1